MAQQSLNQLLESLCGLLLAGYQSTKVTRAGLVVETYGTSLTVTVYQYTCASTPKDI